MLNWTAVYTRSEYEQRVDSDLDALGIEHYLPTFTVQRKYFCRHRATLNLPVFPSYVFARLDSEDIRSRSMIGQITGVCGVLSGVVTDQELASVRRLVEAGARPCEEDELGHLAAGTRVRMRRGPLAGVEGLFMEYGGHGSLIVTIEMLGRSVMAHVNRSDAVMADGRGSSAYERFARVALAGATA